MDTKETVDLRNLKTATEVGDVALFRSTVDYCIREFRKHGYSKSDALDLAEYVCTGMDHGFVNVGVAAAVGETLEPGPVQIFFSRLYGSQ